MTLPKRFYALFHQNDEDFGLVTYKNEADKEMIVLGKDKAFAFQVFHDKDLRKSCEKSGKVLVLATLEIVEEQTT